MGIAKDVLTVEVGRVAMGASYDITPTNAWTVLCTRGPHQQQQVVLDNVLAQSRVPYFWHVQWPDGPAFEVDVDGDGEHLHVVVKVEGRQVVLDEVARGHGRWSVAWQRANLRA